MAARASRYQEMIASSLEQAVGGLGERERRLLALRYVDSLKPVDIAESHGIDPTTIRRQLSRVHNEVRHRVIAILATQFLLNAVAIEECLEEIVENPAYSVLQFLN
jgi:DNA-directed RNA polymerase specialized sigma24 family protein